MKKRMRKLMILGVLVGVFLCSSTVLADSESHLNGSEGDSFTVSSDGKTGKETEGTGESNKNSSESDSTQKNTGTTSTTEKVTEIETIPEEVVEWEKAEDEMREQISEWKNEAITAGKNTVHGIATPTLKYYEYGCTTVDIDSIKKFIENRDKYLLWAKSVASDSAVIEVNTLPQKTITPSASASNLSDEEMVIIKGKIIGGNKTIINGNILTRLHGIDAYLSYKDGINIPFSITTSTTEKIPILGFDISQESIWIPGSPIVTSENEIRSDVIVGGLVDSRFWVDRFYPFDRYITNNEDYVDLVWIKEVSIQSVDKEYTKTVDNTSDVRRWTVYKKNENGTWSQVGAPMLTNNPKHEFVFSSPTKGEYKIVAEQITETITGMYVKYNTCNYFFDAKSKQLLWFTESLVENGGGSGILIDGVSTKEYTPTGDVFYVTVNELGEADFGDDGILIERIE